MAQGCPDAAVLCRGFKLLKSRSYTHFRVGNILVRLQVRPLSMPRHLRVLCASRAAHHQPLPVSSVGPNRMSDWRSCCMSEAGIFPGFKVRVEAGKSRKYKLLKLEIQASEL